MRWMLMLLLMGCLVLMPVMAQEDDSFDGALTAARIAYEEGRYSEAIRIYEALLELGYSHASLYYNLGNSYYENGQLGLALLNYLRAQQLDPPDEATNRNVLRIRAQRADYQGDESYWVDWLSATTETLLTLDALYRLAFFAWNGWFILLAIAFSLKRVKLLRGVVAVTFPIAFMILLLWGSRNYAESYRPKAVLTALVTEVYSGPSEDYLMLYRLYNAAEIHITDVEGAWAKFQLPDGRQGWISRFDFTYVVSDS